MEDPNWDPSQSFGYSAPTMMAPKNPFTPATAQVSPPSASSTRLRWHNSVAEDYSPVNENGGSFKRSASVAMPETCIDYPEQPFEHETPLHHAAPQNKKRKASASSSILSPGQPHQIPDTGLNTVTEGPNGEPAPVVKRKRGRPPKNPHPGNGSSQIEFVNVTDPRPKSKSGSSNSAPKTVRHQESPILQPLDTSFVYNNTSFHGMPHEITSGLEYQATAPWDTSFAASVMGDAAIMGSMTSDINLLDATSTFNWSMMPTTMGDMTPHDMVDPMRPLTMQSFSDSFYQSHLDASAVNFQFAQDPLSASDIISPVSVDPNLIFAGQALGQPFDDGLGSMQPYRQQNLDRQQEEQAQQKRQSKPKPSSKASSKSAKSVAPPASSRPAVNRALTESVLTKSSVSKYSNVTVQSGSAKQMSHRSASGKMRPSVKDENTTPSPSIGAMSVKHVSPVSERARDNKKVRTAVNFSISPGGRAKAETIVVKDRRGSTRNRDEYEEQDPYDTDSSTDEDDLGPIGTGYSMNQQRAVNVKNRHHNSSFNRSMERPKLARFRTEPANSFSTSQYLLSGNFENDSFSYNNPFIPHDMSMSSGMLRKKKSHSKISRRQNGSSSFVSNKSGAYGSMREEEEYSEAETVVDEPVGTSAGDAILALKQAVARKHSRPSRPQTAVSSKRPPSSYGTSRPSTRHTNLVPSSPPMQQPYGLSTPQTVRSGYSTDSFNISPTTVTDPDCVTPSTYGGREYGRRETLDVRCRCGSGSPGMPVLQCNACFKWIHLHCEGYGHKPVPERVVCSFCKGGWQGPAAQQPQVFRKPSIPQTISPATTRGYY